MNLNRDLNAAERFSFASINEAIEWLGKTSSLTCALLSCLLQGRAYSATIADLCRQSARLREWKELGSLTYYALLLYHR